MPKLIPTLNITIPLDEGCLELTRGEVVDAGDIPDGTLDTMLRLGQLVSADDYEVEPEPDEGDTGATPGDWRNTPVTSLGLAVDVQRALIENELRTVQNVLNFGEENGGLTDINGIGEVSERAIQSAIQKLAEAAGA